MAEPDKIACVGPIDPETNRPCEGCQNPARQSLIFPHRDGVAVMFSCPEHLMSLGEWAGRRFGGCYAGGTVPKAVKAMKEAAAKGTRVVTPNGEAFDALVRAPDPPKGWDPWGRRPVSRN